MLCACVQGACVCACASERQHEAYQVIAFFDLVPTSGIRARCEEKPCGAAGQCEARSGDGGCGTMPRVRRGVGGLRGAAMMERWVPVAVAHGNQLGERQSTAAGGACGGFERCLEATASGAAWPRRSGSAQGRRWQQGCAELGRKDVARDAEALSPFVHGPVLCKCT